MPYSNSASQSLSDAQKGQLLSVARASIEQGFRSHHPLDIQCADYDFELQNEGCSFVTLTLNDNLRGCIGSLEAYQPLVMDIAEHAYASAYRDPRFPEVTPEEIPKLGISISVLTPKQKLPCSDETDLLNKLSPNIDGLILEESTPDGMILHKSTFLPSVWEQLPDKRDFLHALKQKAGLPVNYWSEDLKFYTYSTLSFKE